MTKPHPEHPDIASEGAQNPELGCGHVIGDRCCFSLYKDVIPIVLGKVSVFVSCMWGIRYLCTFGK